MQGHSKLNAPAAKSTPPPRKMGVGLHRDGTDMASTRSCVISYPVIADYPYCPAFTTVYKDKTFFPCCTPCNLTLLPILSNSFLCLFFRGQSGFSPPFLRTFSGESKMEVAATRASMLNVYYCVECQRWYSVLGFSVGGKQFSRYCCE